MAIAGFHLSFPHAWGRRGIHCPQVVVTEILRNRGARLRLFTETCTASQAPLQLQVLDASAVPIQGRVGHPEKRGHTV